MKAVFEIKRRQKSISQGEAIVYLNGVEIVNFGDVYELDKNDPEWRKIKPDEYFLLTMLFPSDATKKYYPDSIKQTEQKIRSVLEEN